MFGKKKVVKKAKKEKEPFISQYPILDMNKLTKTEYIKLELQGQLGARTFKTEVPMTYSLNHIKNIINEKNGGSCKNIQLTFQDNKNNIISLEFLNFKTFYELNLNLDSSLVLFYTYEPVENPLLLAGYYSIKN